jgi:hypothetical protein
LHNFLNLLEVCRNELLSVAAQHSNGLVDDPYFRMSRLAGQDFRIDTGELRVSLSSKFWPI